MLLLLANGIFPYQAPLAPGIHCLALERVFSIKWLYEPCRLIIIHQMYWKLYERLLRVHFLYLFLEHPLDFVFVFILFLLYYFLWHFINPRFIRKHALLGNLKANFETRAHYHAVWGHWLLHVFETAAAQEALQAVHVVNVGGVAYLLQRVLILSLLEDNVTVGAIALCLITLRALVFIPAFLLCWVLIKILKFAAHRFQISWHGQHVVVDVIDCHHLDGRVGGIFGSLLCQCLLLLGVKLVHHTQIDAHDDTSLMHLTLALALAAASEVSNLLEDSLGYGVLVQNLVAFFCILDFNHHI